MKISYNKNEVKKLIQMSELLKMIPITQEEENKIPTDKARKALILKKLENALIEEKVLLGELSEEEELAVKELTKDLIVDDVPEYISVKEVAWLTGLSPQIVRRHCAKHKYIAYQPSGENGTWYIESDQFRSFPNWEEFLQVRTEMLKRSQHTNKLAFQLWYETDNDSFEKEQ